MFSDKNLAVQALSIERDIFRLFVRLKEAIEQSTMSDAEKKSSKDYIYVNFDHAITCLSVVIYPRFPELAPEDEGYRPDYWNTESS